MNVDELAGAIARVGRPMPPADVDLVAQLAAPAGCPVCLERSACTYGDDCPRIGADLGERGCAHCGERSNCSHDDACPRWHAGGDRRAELRGELAELVDVDEAA